MMQRCFVGFFGITRGLDKTIDSIERNIFAPLERAGLELTRAAHFNNPQQLNSVRSKEVGITFTLGDRTRLKLDYEVIEPQSDVNIAPYLDAALGVPFQREDDADGSTRRNAVQQLYSLRGLSRILIEARERPFDVVVLLRPDLLYIDPLPIRKILAQLHRGSPWRRSVITEGVRTLRRLGRPEADIVVPDWHSWGGLNDRFAIATPEAALVYMKRIERVVEFCAERNHFHPESILQFALNRAGMRCVGTWARAQRVRSTGAVAELDLQLAEPNRKADLTRSLRQALQI